MSDRVNIRLFLIVIALTTLVTLGRVDVGVAADRKSIRTPGATLAGSTGAAGVSALTGQPLPASPLTGSLTPGSNDDDVYTVSLQAGQRLRVEVTGASGDIDAYLLWPGAAALAPPYAASAFTTSTPEVLVFDAAVSGTYLLDLYCAGAETSYTVTYTKTRATNGKRFARVYGPDRYSTAIAISRQTFAADSTQDIVIAGGGNYPDALSASSLAGSLGCPLLLTRQDTLSSGVATEIDRLGAKTVHVVGGPMSVSPTVLSQLKSRGLTVERFYGTDRFDVAYRVGLAVKQLKPGAGKTVFLASGEVFPDALSASPYAYRMGYPILLTRAGSLHPKALAALVQLGTTRVYIAGGPRSVSSTVENQLKQRGIAVTRLYGQDRYQTARAIAQHAIVSHWGDPSVLAVASGEVFPDALTGGAACGARGGTMVLTGQARLGTEASRFASTWSDLGLVDDTRVLGGPNSVGNSAASSLKSVVSR